MIAMYRDAPYGFEILSYSRHNKASRIRIVEPPPAGAGGDAKARDNVRHGRDAATGLEGICTTQEFKV
jgi:hypothetical protein